MGQEHRVVQGEWLARIATKLRRSAKELWDANPELQKMAGGNPNVLMPGWVIKIPEKVVKTISAATGRIHPHVRDASEIVVRLTLQYPADGTGSAPVAESWKCAVDVGKLSSRVASSGEVTIKKLPTDASRVKLSLEQPRPFRVGTFKPQEVTLRLGEFDPIGPGKPGNVGIQKVLTNLGYYRGRIDGILGPVSRAAIAAFQYDSGIKPPTGEPDDKTLAALVKAGGNPMKTPSGRSLDVPATSPRFTALKGVGAEAAKAAWRGTDYTGYTDPEDPDQSLETRGKRKLQRFDVFPREVYVAPSEEGGNPQNKNVIRARARRFILLDCGLWQKEEYDFGLIWGRHVYLCQYVPTAGAGGTGGPSEQGLDAEVLRVLGSRVRVVKQASAYWAPDGDFDWSKVYVILPDLHLMDGQVGEIWIPGFFRGPRALEAELRLLEFAHTLCAAPSLRERLHVVQLGDCYDLWLGATDHGIDGPLFVEDTVGRTIRLKDDPDAVSLLGDWLRDIRGLARTWVTRLLNDRNDYSAILSRWGRYLYVEGDRGRLWNPAEAALQLFQRTLGSNTTILRGNHDNYLAIGSVCAAGGITPRRSWYAGRSVFFEHGHRLEGTRPSGGNNYDGCHKGYQWTALGYWGMRHLPLVTRAGRRAEGALVTWFDQPYFIDEYAQVWLGRESEGRRQPPHIFVIGHTHVPNLWHVSIDAWHEPLMPPPDCVHDRLA